MLSKEKLTEQWVATIARVEYANIIYIIYLYKVFT